MVQGEAFFLPCSWSFLLISCTLLLLPLETVTITISHPHYLWLPHHQPLFVDHQSSATPLDYHQHHSITIIFTLLSSSLAEDRCTVVAVVADSLSLSAFISAWTEAAVLTNACCCYCIPFSSVELNASFSLAVCSVSARLQLWLPLTSLPRKLLTVSTSCLPPSLASLVCPCHPCCWVCRRCRVSISLRAGVGRQGQLFSLPRSSSPQLLPPLAMNVYFRWG